MKLITTLIGATMLAGGIAKLMRNPADEQLIDKLDWTDEERQRIGIAEIVGGGLMLLGPTAASARAAAVVLAVSGSTLSSGLRSRQTQLAAPGSGVMLGAAVAVAAGL